MKPNVLIYCFCAILASGVLSASPKKKTPPSDHDSIDVLAQVPLPNASVARMATGVHWRRNLLYVERGSDGAIAVFDVTRPKEPKAVTQFVPQSGGTVHLNAVVGNAALLTSAAPETTQAPQTVSIVSFAETTPKVVREFTGVTFLLKDQARSLIYLANADGVWVLHENPAEDVELLREYDEYIKGLR